MIAYEILVQTIADWKAGVRPSAPIPPAAPVGAPENVEELASGVVDLDEGYTEEPAVEDYGEGYGQDYQDYGGEAEQADEGGYEYEPPATETYDDEM